MPGSAIIIITVSVTCVYGHHSKIHRKSVFMSVLDVLLRKHTSFAFQVPCHSHWMISSLELPGGQ